MSLNGLDGAPVAEAYASALAEAGGWFLLKYASRDAIEILTRGTGGLVEARGAIAQYEDKSPLYGFLLYRRRKVLIKYTPEGTSRLLQARVTVHFQAVTEKFSPHDTILPITSAEDLSDAALSAACSLHTAAPSSSSSSSSSRRRKLDEITEDAEEGQATADDTSSMTRPMTAASTIPTIVEPSSPNTRTEAKSEASEQSTVRGSMDRRPTTPRAKTSVSQISVDAVLESANSPTPDQATADYVASLRNYENHFDHSYEARLSSQTARPSTSELYDYLYKPKVKLGPRPRPSVDAGKRPHTSGTGSKEDARPVSQLPPGLRIAQRKTDPRRPKSRDSSIVPSIAFPPPPPIPHIPELSLITPMRPGSSPASIRSLPARTPGMTPEKQRLMKALELRKKQMNSRKAKEANEADKARDAALTPAAVVAEVSPPAELEQAEKPLAVEHEPEKIEPSPATEELPELKSVSNTHDSSSTVTEPPKTDSAVEVLEDDHPESEDLQSASASSPTSAQTQGSSESPSTRPSSVSEEDDHIDHDQETKPDLHVKSTNFGVDGQADIPNCQDTPVEESVESSPTVVPEDNSPVPSIEVIAPATTRSENGRDKVEPNPPHVSETEETVPSQPSPSPTPADLKRRSTVEVRQKRRALVEPIRIDLTTADASDTEYLSDDSFMEELQSAKFEQAQPISVSKSPISPLFPRKFSNQSVVSIPERSSSSHFLPGERRSPEVFGGDRTSSGSWLTKPNQENLTVAKKINVSSGISQRIKALAEKSNRESTASVSPVTPPEASSSIVAQRKSSFRTPPASTGPSPVLQHTKRFSRQSFASFTNPSPNRQSFIQPPETTNPMYNVQQIDKPESVQVTARIIRDPRTEKPNLTMPTQDSPLELHQSPLIIDHQKAQKVLIPVSSSRISLARPEPASPEPPGSPQSKEASSSGLPRSSSESSWRSLGRRMSEAKPPPTAVSVRSQSAASLESFDEKKDDKKDSKRDSRTSRLFKRMSSSMSISSASRKNLASLSPTVHEEDHEANLPSLREPPPAVQVGDLNIQFPDTLLWKRRWVEIDGSGNIVLTLSKANDRFHLTEFRTPYSPDQDAQELPNSVILDFLDGRTLQCACETYVSQVHVLQILREAHEAWMAYGQ
ncbi:hypothetical protein BU16DRAFT_163038 [Lophium mytilinum]|uniref:ADF-H domain-containing protein n=1 Tax=Lophium mytilinum TaxID=390894 RepID=A0A6A6QCF4_9PEZI|nr:hypothetical protein BU16DRAFT_163038 [Lophium mytilinum]